MNKLQEMLKPYIIRFKEQYSELEEETGNNKLTGSQRREWMKNRVQSAFSRENIDKLKTDEAIDILSNFYSIQYGGGPGKNAKTDHNEWSTGIVKQDFVAKAKILLYGNDPFPDRYYQVTGIGGLKHGILSEFLCYYDPQKYGPILGTSTKALRIFGLDYFDMPRSGKRAGVYALAFFEKLQGILIELKKDPFFTNADLLTLDYFLYFVAKSSFWRIAGGKNGALWSNGSWQKYNIASFGLTGIEQELGGGILTASESDLKAAYARIYPEKIVKSKTETVRLLNLFIHEVQIGDVLVVNKGTTSVLGYGIVNSDPHFSKQYPDPELSLNRDMIWVKQGMDTPIPDDLKNQFAQTISVLSNKDAKKLLSDIEDVVIENKEENMSEEYKRMEELLRHKKQIILYGPPGTGKTYHANKFISNFSQENYEVSEESLLDQRIFILTTVASRDGIIPDMKKEEQFSYGWSDNRNWPKYYEELQEGDLALAYSADRHQLTSVVRCVRKEKEKILFEIVFHFEGPTFQDMKKDSALKDSEFIRGTLSFSLKRLKEGEIEGIIQISKGLTFDSLGITLDKTEEIVKNKEFVTFHPSFGYEDFIEGLRPITREDGTLGYRVEDGIFKNFSRDAFNVLASNSGIKKEWSDSDGIPELTNLEKEKIKEKAPDYPFYLIIDEINRGDISRIFGELITLLEADKRYGEENELITKLPYSKQNFAIPPNLYLIGTMNTADKSIALIDLALRRRFGFIECMPKYEVLSSIADGKDPETQKIAKIALDLLKTLNTKIIANYDRDHQIGHSYLTKLKDVNSSEEAVKLLHFVWYHEIIPILQEYYYDSPRKLKEILGSDFVLVTNNERTFSFTEVLREGEFIEALQRLSNPNNKADLVLSDE